MKKISYTCDICGKDATINYYTISFKQNLDQLGRVTVDGAARNYENFFRILNNNELIYCEKCVKAIEEYIRIASMNKLMGNIDGTGNRTRFRREKL